MEKLKMNNFANVIECLNRGGHAKRMVWQENREIVKQVPQCIIKDIVPRMTSLPDSIKPVIGTVGSGEISETTVKKMTLINLYIPKIIVLLQRCSPERVYAPPLEDYLKSSSCILNLLESISSLSYVTSAPFRTRVTEVMFLLLLILSLSETTVKKMTLIN